MFIHRNLLKTFSTLVILTMLFSGFPLSPAAAQAGDGLKHQRNTRTGKVSFIGPETGRSLSAAKALGRTFSARSSDPGRALVKRFGPEFGLNDPDAELAESQARHTEDGRLVIRYQQQYQGIPVLGGELLVDTNDNGDLYSINGEVSADLSLSTQPAIDPEQARQAALQGAAEWYQDVPESFAASDPELWIYDASLLQPGTRPAELVWRMEVTAVDRGRPIRELVLVNAGSGEISLHFNQIDTAWGDMGSRRGSSTSSPHWVPGRAPQASAALQTGEAAVETYTGHDRRTIDLPGDFVCSRSNPNCGGDLDAKAAQAYAIGVYDFYRDKHNRYSIDDGNMTIISTVHYCDPDPEEYCPYDNAYWSGDQMVYGDSESYARADDIVGHELTHGVTQYESNLFYYFQSGAINESFSDLWGEYYDQMNVEANDTPDVKWLIGEDVRSPLGYRVGPFRNMKYPFDPNPFSTDDSPDPDKMSSPHYETSTYDSGGVHTNSGINNKAVFLMVDGAPFNGKTVESIGWTKTAAIYYEVNANILTSAADYSDLYYALQQACSTLIGGPQGITDWNCVQVKNAIDAVEMNGQPESNFNTEAPVCDSGDPTEPIYFKDDLESGTANWTFSNGLRRRWQIQDNDSMYGPYATSGSHSLYADDLPSERTDASAILDPLTIPQNAYLRFAQAYEFQTDLPDYYDGGVLEYKIGNGSWTDAGGLIDTAGNGYDGTIYPYNDNPLKDRLAFVGASHGYISTRLNLGTLAGKSISFRWRMGLDTSEYGGTWGWWVDDVQIYQCQDLLAPGAVTGLTAAPGTADGTVNLSWLAPADDAGVNISGPVQAYQVKYSATPVGDWNVGGTDYTTGLPTPAAPGTQESLTISGLAPGTRYYFAIRSQDDSSHFSGYISANAIAKFTTAEFLGGVLLSSPAQRARVNDATPLLDWSDHSPTAAYYQIQVSTENTFDSTVYDLQMNASKFQVPSNLTSGTTYYWRVRAYDFLDQPAAWSMIRSFTIDTDLPAAPTLRSPANTASVRGTPTFKWDSVSGALLYEFQLDDDAGFASPLVSVTQRTTSRRPPGNLRGTYSWRVRAQDAAGNWSPWSTVFTVTILPPR